MSATRIAPQVLESESGGLGGGPFLCGLLNPAIVLPHGFVAALEPQALRAILAHEASHAKRRDLWWSTLARLCCVLLWPQPLMWLLARRLEAAQEESCDQAVLSAGCAPHHYASCLLSLAEQLQMRPLRRASGLGNGLGVVPARSALARRVRQILSGTGDDSPSRRAKVGPWRRR